VPRERFVDHKIVKIERINFTGEISAPRSEEGYFVIKSKREDLILANKAQEVASSIRALKRRKKTPEGRRSLSSEEKKIYKKKKKTRNHTAQKRHLLPRIERNMD